MRLAGTWNMYSKNAIDQLMTAATYHLRSDRFRRWAYQANVMNVLDRISRPTVLKTIDMPWVFLVGVADRARHGAHSEHRHREERPERVVGLAQARREQAHHRPQDLVGQLAIEVHQHLEVGAADRERRGAAVGDGVRGALAPVEYRHLAEHGPRLEDGEGLLSAARDVAADSHLAVGDQVQPVPCFAFVED